jgi:hypothetical protein
LSKFRENSTKALYAGYQLTVYKGFREIPACEFTLRAFVKSIFGYE